MILRGTVALVTGGSQGIGAGICRGMAKAGAAVVVHGLDQVSAETTADEIRSAGGVAEAAWGPIDQAETSRTAVQLAVDRFGRLDHLVCSAGIQRYGDVVSTSEQVWARSSTSTSRASPRGA